MLAKHCAWKERLASMLLPTIGKIPWIWKWQPMPVFLPEKSMDRGAWWAAVHGAAKSRTRLSVRTVAAVTNRWASSPHWDFLSLINKTKLETDFIAYKCMWCFCTFMLDLLLAILIILGICINSILEWTVLHLFCILNQAKTWGTEKKMLRWRLGCPIVQRFFFFYFASTALENVVTFKNFL